MTATAQTRLLDLYGYQKRWLEDRSRFKVALWSRQCGKSFVLALEAVLDCLERKTTWVMLSRGERQSRELMDKVHMLARALGHVVDDLLGFESEFEQDGRRLKQLEQHFPNGSRIIGLPANPDTGRGYTANVVLDEFAIQKNSREIWKALYGSISRGYSLRVASTPMGKQGKFYELWSANDNTWSKHRTDIYDSVKEGNPQNPEELRRGLADEEAWAQEYECQFLDEAVAFLPYDLIDDAESELATMERPALLDSPEWIHAQNARLYMGFDVGRHRDLSVMWTLEDVGGVLWTREVLRLQKTRFAVQREALYERLSSGRTLRCCIDRTGIGIQLAEEAAEKFGWRVEGVHFTPAVKQELAHPLRARLEDRVLRIPQDQLVRGDLHSVKKVATASGNVRFDVDRSESGGFHADHFWALALAHHAFALGKENAEPVRVMSAPTLTQSLFEGYGGFTLG